MDQLSGGDCMRALPRSDTGRAKRPHGRVLHHPGVVEARSNPADQHYLLSLIPFAALLAVVREPLLGQLPTVDDWIAAGVFSIGGVFVAPPPLCSFRPPARLFL